MIVAKREVVECDQCGGHPAETVTVATDDETWDLDLCRRCLAPLRALRPRQNARFQKITLPPQPN